jgi:hypothetical protein
VAPSTDAKILDDRPRPRAAGGDRALHTNLKHERIVEPGLLAQKGWFPFGKPSRFATATFQWIGMLRHCVAFRSSVALHFTPKAYPEGSPRSSSLFCIENPSSLWML